VEQHRPALAEVLLTERVVVTQCARIGAGLGLRVCAAMKGGMCLPAGRRTPAVQPAVSTVGDWRVRSRNYGGASYVSPCVLSPYVAGPQVFTHTLRFGRVFA
jgi:hypothetical protein